MAIFQPTEYLRPATPDDVADVLVKYGPSARVIGGGTELYELAERGLLSDITTLVDLANLKLDRIEEGVSALDIGSGVRLAELEKDDAVNRRPALGAVLDSVRSIHPVQVKNLATVGGAVCSSISFFDLPVGLAAVGAMVEVSGLHGARRRRPVSEFIVDFLTPDLEEGEFVTGVTVEHDACSASAFTKFSLTSNDWAIVNCACALKIVEGSVASARVVFGGLSGSGLLDAAETARSLQGMAAEPGRRADSTMEALDGELKDVTSDYRASADYRRRLAKVLLRDALDGALTRERG